MLSWTVFAFSEIKIDQSTTSFTDFENSFGHIFFGIFYATIGVNLIYLIPSKMCEVYCIIKRIFLKIIRWCKYKVNIKAKLSRHAHKFEKNTQWLPKSSNSQNIDNEWIIEVVSKSKQNNLEREITKLQEGERINPYHRDFLAHLNINEENKIPRITRKIIHFI